MRTKRSVIGRALQGGLLIQHDLYRNGGKKVGIAPLVDEGAHEGSTLELVENFWRDAAADADTATNQSPCYCAGRSRRGHLPTPTDDSLDHRHKDRLLRAPFPPRSAFCCRVAGSNLH